jgi:hypothetical protein
VLPAAVPAAAHREVFFTDAAKVAAAQTQLIATISWLSVCVHGKVRHVRQVKRDRKHQRPEDDGL